MTDHPAARRHTTARRLAATTAPAAALALAMPAWAEITPEQALQEFTDYYEDSGYVVEVGSREARGDAIVLGDLVLGFEVAAPTEGQGLDEETREALEDQRISVTLDELTFAPDGEGVLVTAAPGGQVETRLFGADSGMVETTVHALSMEGLSVTIAEAGEGGEGRRYDYEAGALASTLLKATSGGEPVDADATFTLTGLAGQNTVTPEGDDRRGLASSSTIERMAFDLALPAQAEEPFPGAGARGATTVSVAAEAVTLTADGTTPADLAGVMERAEADPGVFFREVLDGAVEMALGATSLSIAQEPGTPPQDQGFTGEVSYETTGLTVGFGEGAISYETSATGARFSAQGGGMAVPSVEGGYDEGAFALTAPLTEADEAQPASLRSSVQGLTLSEDVWSLFDPQALLPREPASLDLTLDGQMRVTGDIFAPDADPTAPPPFEFDQAGLSLALDMVGATLNAQGDFTLDNEDTITFTGFPAPTGTLEIEATGIDVLLDTLSQMGLVAQDQLMPARMMLGLFARPDGDGGYVSTIEVDGAEGAVTANGQRIR